MRDADSSITVLHVDDEPDFGEMVATFLQREDDRFDVRTAESASEGLTILSDSDVDCIVSDYDMPGRNGIEFLEAVRASYPDLPFVLFTGKGSEEVASDAISAGVTEYLQKETGTGQYAVLANRIRVAVENHRAQQRLADREQRLELFFEQSPLGVIEWDETFTATRMNEAAEEIFGYAESELVGESWAAIVPESSEEDVEDLVADLLADSAGYHAVNENVRADGERITCEWHNRVVTDDAGEVVAIYSLFQDISDRERQTQQLATLIDNLPGMVYRCRNETGWPMECVRGEVQELTGYTSSAIENQEGLWGEEIVHPEDRTEVWDGVQDALDKRESFEITYRIHTREGETKWVWERGQGISSNGRVVAIEGFVTDITARKELVQQLEDEREFIGQALDTLDDVFYVVGTDGAMQRWNSRLVEVTGYTDAELAEMDAVDLFPPEERERVDAAIDEVLERGEAVIESTFETAAGDRIPYEFTGARLADCADDELGLVGIGRDVSERTAYEQRLAALHEVADDLTTVESRETVYERTIEASQDILQFDLSVITVEDDGRLVPTAISEDIDTDGMTVMSVEEGLAGKTYRTGESFLVDDVQTHPDANPQGPYASAISVPIGDYGNFQAVTEAAGTFDESDLELAELLVTHTENALERFDHERQLEEQNRQLEEFASVVSHDLRNPLSVAKGRLELAREDCDSEHLDPAETAVDRSLALVDDLLTLAREGNRVRDVESVSLSAVVEASWSNVDTHEASLVAESQQTVWADRSQLKQLFENLLRNAVEHGGDDVTITVADLDGGFYLEDDGPGIAADDRASVFEAGYSTSDAGTGFGLSIVQEIADAHDWHVTIGESEAGGARFEFTSVDVKQGS